MRNIETPVAEKFSIAADILSEIMKGVFNFRGKIKDPQPIYI